MFTKLKQINSSGKGRYLAVMTVFAFVVTSFGAVMMPQKASAYLTCNLGPDLCSATVNNCLVFQPKLLANSDQKRCIAAIQGFFKDPGAYNLSAMKVDGLYGPQTEGVVKMYQWSHGIGIDGIIGPDTWKKIKADCSKFSASRVCDSSWAYF